MQIRTRSEDGSKKTMLIVEAEIDALINLKFILLQICNLRCSIELDNWPRRRNKKEKKKRGEQIKRDDFSSALHQLI
jgi:hypothetical protein